VRHELSEILELALVRAREFYPVAGIEGQEVFAVDMRFHFPNLPDVDNGGSMDTLQDASIQFLLQLLHGCAHDVSFSAGLDAHVITGCVYPFDIPLVDPGRAAAVVYCQTGWFLAHRVSSIHKQGFEGFHGQVLIFPSGRIS